MILVAKKVVNGTTTMYGYIHPTSQTVFWSMTRYPEAQIAPIVVDIGRRTVVRSAL